MKYEYGISYNCVSCDSRSAFNFEVGGGNEGDSTVDFVSNNFDKLVEAVISNGKEEGFEYECRTEHAYVGGNIDVGDEVVAVIGEDEEDFYVACVVFKHPVMPIVIK